MVRCVSARTVDRGQGRGRCCVVLMARSCSISYVVVVQLWLWNSGDGTRLPFVPAISDERVRYGRSELLFFRSTFSFHGHDDDRNGEEDQKSEQRYPRARRQIAAHQGGGMGGLCG